MLTQSSGKWFFLCDDFANKLSLNQLKFFLQGEYLITLCKCKIMDAVCGCRATSSEPQKIYFGLADGKWKQRYYNHKIPFSHKQYSRETRLSSYLWHLKQTFDVSPNLKWSVVRCAKLDSNTSKKCLLCLCEKLVVTTYPRQHKLLNKRSELFANAVMRISTFWKTLELMTKVN